MADAATFRAIKHDTSCTPCRSADDAISRAARTLAKPKAPRDDRRSAIRSITNRRARVLRLSATSVRDRDIVGENHHMRPSQRLPRLAVAKSPAPRSAPSWRGHSLNGRAQSANRVSAVLRSARWLVEQPFGLASAACPQSASVARSARMRSLTLRPLASVRDSGMRRICLFAGVPMISRPPPAGMAAILPRHAHHTMESK